MSPYQFMRSGGMIQ